MGKQKNEVLLLKIDGELREFDTEYPGTEINSQYGEVPDVEGHFYMHLGAPRMTGLYTDVQYGGIHRQNEIKYFLQRAKL